MVTGQCVRGVSIGPIAEKEAKEVPVRVREVEDSHHKDSQTKAHHRESRLRQYLQRSRSLQTEEEGRNPTTAIVGIAEGVLSYRHLPD